jgi:hypothetical protein
LRKASANLEDAALFEGDLRESVAQHVLMIVAQRRDAANHGMHDVGRIRPSAHSDLDHRHIHLHPVLSGHYYSQ